MSENAKLARQAAERALDPTNTEGGTPRDAAGLAALAYALLDVADAIRHHAVTPPAKSWDL